MNSKKNREHWHVLVGCLLCAGLLSLSYGLFFKSPSALGMQEQAQKNVNSTKTVLAGTANALLGPFPTATSPTRTPSPTATATPIISATPSMTPSVTRSPSATPNHVVSATPKKGFDINTFLLGLTPVAVGISTPHPGTPTLSLSNTEVPPTINTDSPPPVNTDAPPPTDPPTEPPPPTDPPVEPPPPTDPPVEPLPPTDAPVIP